jgi:hypothetical protein
MQTPPEGSGLVCGICGATAEELASPLHPPLDAPIVIRTMRSASRRWRRRAKSERRGP